MKAKTDPDAATGKTAGEASMVALEPGPAVWQRVFSVAPLVVVGTREANGAHDLAPKHLAMPVGPSDRYVFACTPRHRTWVNARREGSFTVSYPRPDQVVLASLAASPRCEDDVKHALRALATTPAEHVAGVLLADAYLHLECDRARVLEDPGDGPDGYGLIVGRVVAARADRDALRDAEGDDQDLLRRSPLLAYLPPTRYARIADSRSFPFPAGIAR